MRQLLIKKYIFLSLTLIALFSILSKPVYATFIPGETSDPGCQPTDSNCNVVANIFSNLNLASLSTPPSPATDRLYNLGGILYWNGGAVSGSGGILSINGLLDGSQTFATSTTGTDFTISSALGVHTFNLPSASSANRGLLTSADWSTFNGKENAISSGTSAQYYRGDKTWQTLDTSVVPENTNLYYTTTRFNTGFSSKTTDNLTEGATNKYFSNTLARGAVSASSPLSYDSLTGIFSIGASSSTANGYLSSTDWSTFNNKLGPP